MTLVLVRHGETAWNAERRMQGRTDNPLNATGRAQAREVAIALEGVVADRVVASPLVRARQTAGVVAAHLGLVDVVIDGDLLERDFGDAEGMPVAGVAERWPDGDYPGAEPLAAVAARGARALARWRGEDAIVVAHGVLLRATLERITGAPVARIRNGEPLLLHADGRLERPAAAADASRRAGRP